jgi:hypothetical protein
MFFFEIQPRQVLEYNLPRIVSPASDRLRRPPIMFNHCSVLRGTIGIGYSNCARTVRFFSISSGSVES